MAGDLLTIVDAEGAGFDLDDDASAVRRMRGTTGRFMPKIDRHADTVAFQPGERLRSVRHTAREVAIPIRASSTELGLRTTLRDLARRLDPTRGDVTLRNTAIDGAVRQLTCRYDGGLEIDEGEGFAPGGYQRAVLVFVAADPYWYDESAIVTSFTAGTPASFFPFFPLRLSSSEVFADASVDNAGDVDAWPVWTIAGPCTELYLRSFADDVFAAAIFPFDAPAADQVLHLTTTLAAGETLTIDTRPGYKTVTAFDGTNLFSLLDPAARAMWPLNRGSNSIRIEMSGADVGSSVNLSYKQGWLAP